MLLSCFWKKVYFLEIYPLLKIVKCLLLKGLLLWHNYGIHAVKLIIKTMTNKKSVHFEAISFLALLWLVVLVFKLAGSVITLKLSWVQLFLPIVLYSLFVLIQRNKVNNA